MSEQLTFPSLAFPGRKTLTIAEFAQALSISPRHVMDLIEEGKLAAIDVGGGERHHWRIPIEEGYADFLRARKA